MLNIEGMRKADSLQEALTLLDGGERTKLIAGGTDILLAARKNKLEGCTLISIADIGELRRIRLDTEGDLHIGACASFDEILQNGTVRSLFPSFLTAVRQIGSPQIRRVATLGGNICNGAVSADSIALLIALDAECVIVNGNGSRVIPIAEIHAGPGKTVLAHGDILYEVILRGEKLKNYGASYYKYGRRNAMEIATIGCASAVRLERENGTLLDVVSVFTVAGPRPVRCRFAEEKVQGMKPVGETFEALAGEAMKQIQPRDSWRASREFREQIAFELAVRTLSEAAENGKGGAVC